MGLPRPKLKVMSLTDAAAARVKALMAKSNPPAAALRIGVKKGGCAGMEYTLDYAAEIKPGEDVVEEKGVTVVVEPGAVLFLLGTTMDYKVDKLTSGFVFNNPNQTSACGCGESVALTPARPDALAIQ
ncbi:HesB/IscA family protein [Chelatococcus sp. GCM10030263]|uniref:HesB/IscA family protein n=1 Tax=Chelatococcus sp. GCM10030263 TaxID=3273387 RepID=UPI00361A10F1